MTGLKGRDKIRPSLKQKEREKITMKIQTEQNLIDFNFWSGAADNASLLTYTELNEIESQLEEIYPDGMDQTQLNDLFWFDFETVCEWIGLDVDDVMERGE